MIFRPQALDCADTFHIGIEIFEPDHLLAFDHCRQQRVVLTSNSGVIKYLGCKREHREEQKD